MARTIEELLGVFLDFAITHTDFPPVPLTDTPRSSQEVVAVTDLQPTNYVEQLTALGNFNDERGVAVVCPNYNRILQDFSLSSLMDFEEKDMFVSFIQNMNTASDEEKRSLIDTYVVNPLVRGKNVDAYWVYIAVPSFGTTSTVYTSFVETGA